MKRMLLGCLLPSLLGGCFGWGDDPEPNYGPDYSYQIPYRPDVVNYASCDELQEDFRERLFLADRNKTAEQKWWRAQRGSGFLDTPPPPRAYNPQQRLLAVGNYVYAASPFGIEIFEKESLMRRGRFAEPMRELAEIWAAESAVWVVVPSHSGDTKVLRLQPEGASLVERDRWTLSGYFREARVVNGRLVVAMSETLRRNYFSGYPAEPEEVSRYHAPIQVVSGLAAGVPCERIQKSYYADSNLWLAKIVTFAKGKAPDVQALQGAETFSMVWGTDTFAINQEAEKKWPWQNYIQARPASAQVAMTTPDGCFAPYGSFFTGYAQKSEGWVGRGVHFVSSRERVQGHRFKGDSLDIVASAGVYPSQIAFPYWAWERFIWGAKHSNVLASSYDEEVGSSVSVARWFNDSLALFFKRKGESPELRMMFDDGREGDRLAVPLRVKALYHLDGDRYFGVGDILDASDKFVGLGNAIFALSEGTSPRLEASSEFSGTHSDAWYSEAHSFMWDARALWAGYPVLRGQTQVYQLWEVGAALTNTFDVDHQDLFLGYGSPAEPLSLRGYSSNGRLLTVSQVGYKLHRKTESGWESIITLPFMP